MRAPSGRGLRETRIDRTPLRHGHTQVETPEALQPQRNDARIRNRLLGYGDAWWLLFLNTPPRSNMGINDDRSSTMYVSLGAGLPPLCLPPSFCGRSRRRIETPRKPPGNNTTDDSDTRRHHNSSRTSQCKYFRNPHNDFHFDSSPLYDQSTVYDGIASLNIRRQIPLHSSSFLTNER